MNKGVIGFSRKVERKSLLLDRILKENPTYLLKVPMEDLKHNVHLKEYQLDLQIQNFYEQ